MMYDRDRRRFSSGRTATLNFERKPQPQRYPAGSRRAGTIAFVPGPDQDDLLTFDDLFDAELGEVTKPDVTPVAGPELAIGSDIHVLGRGDSPIANRPPLDGIDAVLVAYLLDVDQATVASDADGSTHAQVESEVTKPERPPRQ